MDDLYHPRTLLTTELTQQRQQGAQAAPLARVEAQLSADLSATQVGALWQQLDALPPREGWPYAEPNDLDAIRASLPAEPPRRAAENNTFAERIYGGVLGRCAGCMLGKPLEGLWQPALIRGYLESVGAWPLDGYVPLADPFPTNLPHFPWAEWPHTTRGNIRQVMADDDIEYLILASLIMAHAGRDFTTADVARGWLLNLAYERVFTAERVAYRNLINDVPLDAVAATRNPFREWIGAQIRADGYGYVSPGDPWQAARRAWHDARLSHTGNGVYGALWVAGMVAAAFVLDDPAAIVEAGLSVVPPRSRLAEAVRRVQAWSQIGTWEETHRRIQHEIGAAYEVERGLNAVHTIPNACLVAMALLHGDGDYTRSVTLAVMGGYDTDCNGATVGSVLGVMLGPAGIPAAWSAPLNDTIQSNLPRQNGLSISGLAERFAALL